MSPFFDDLERQLRDAARARVGAGDGAGAGARAGAGAGGPAGAPAAGPRWGRLRAGLRAAPVALAVLSTVGVVAAALLLLGHRGGAPGGPLPSQPPGADLATLLNRTPKAQLRREVGYIAAASRKVMASPGCRVDQEGGPRVVPGSPGQSMLSTLGVLRRRPSAADRPSAQALSGVTEAYAGYVRRALVRRGVSYYLVATHDDPRLWSPPVRCLRRELAALDQSLRSIPASLRVPTRQLAAQLVASEERAVATAPRDTLCVVSVWRNGGGTSCGVTLAQVRAGQATDDNGVLTGVVPDGVASVTVHFPGGQRADAHGRVVNNLFAVAVGTDNGLPAGATVTWRAADGRVVKTVAQPSARAMAIYCRRHPASCATMTAAGGGYSESSSSASASASATTPRSAPPTTGG